MGPTGVGRRCPECGSAVPGAQPSCRACGAVVAGPPAPPAVPVAPPSAPPRVPGDTPTTPVVLPPFAAPPWPPASADRARPATRGVAPDRLRTPSDDTQPRPPIAGQAPFLSDLPFEAPDSAAGRLAALGTWSIVLSFPLPWASSPFLGWFDAWGFSPMLNLVPFLLALAAALAAIVPSRLPQRVRQGYVPFAAGVAGAGLAWGSLGYLGAVGVGLWLLAIGALLSAAGGLWRLLDDDRAARRR